MSKKTYRCPKCNGSNFKRWELPHPIILHWILNPGLAFNEIILGQRLPKTQLICQDCQDPLMDRAYVPCPSCKMMHWGRLATKKNAFKNWRGISCPSCKEAIPCLWNIFSLIILALTFPIWALPYFLHFKKQPLKPLYQINETEAQDVKPLTRKTWISMGVLWGLLMLIFMTSFTALRTGEFNWESVLSGVLVWSIGGFSFGFFMWFFLGRRTHRSNKQIME